MTWIPWALFVIAASAASALWWRSRHPQIETRPFKPLSIEQLHKERPWDRWMRIAGAKMEDLAFGMRHDIPDGFARLGTHIVGVFLCSFNAEQSVRTQRLHGVPSNEKMPPRLQSVFWALLTRGHYIQIIALKFVASHIRKHLVALYDELRSDAFELSLKGELNAIMLTVRDECSKERRAIRGAWAEDCDLMTDDWVEWHVYGSAGQLAAAWLENQSMTEEVRDYLEYMFSYFQMQLKTLHDMAAYKSGPSTSSITELGSGHYDPIGRD